MDDSTRLIIERIDRLENKLDHYISKDEHAAICGLTQDRLGKLEKAVFGTLGIVILAVIGAVLKLVNV